MNEKPELSLPGCPPAQEEGSGNGFTAETGQNASTGLLGSFPKWHKAGPGRPSKAQIKAEKKLKAVEARQPPTGTWGGRRAGSGRKKRPAKKKMAMVRMGMDVATALESLPKGAKSRYIREALELMTTLQSPAKFLQVNEGIDARDEPANAEIDRSDLPANADIDVRDEPEKALASGEESGETGT